MKWSVVRRKLGRVDRAIDKAIANSEIPGAVPIIGSDIVDIRRRMIKDIVCLGDIIGYGPNPRECLQELMNCKAVLMGNHDIPGVFYNQYFAIDSVAGIVATNASKSTVGD